LVKIPEHKVTPLIRVMNIERIFRIREVYLKYEGVNPTGTHKDRLAREHVIEALKKGFDTITTATCGNYGVSIAYFAKRAEMDAIIYLPRGYFGTRIRELTKLGARIVWVRGTYEEAVYRSRTDAIANNWYNANPGIENRPISIRAYSKIAFEIVDQLGSEPTTLTIPVGNGTTLTGIFHGLLMLKEQGKINKLPQLIAVSTIHGNPVVISFQKKLRRVTKLAKVRETKYNEPLVARESFDGEEALKALWATKGIAIAVPDWKMVEYSKILSRKEDLSVLPASASVLEALNEIEELGKHVLLITAKRVK